MAKKKVKKQVHKKTVHRAPSKKEAPKEAPVAPPSDSLAPIAVRDSPKEIVQERTAPSVEQAPKPEQVSPAAEEKEEDSEQKVEHNEEEKPSPAKEVFIGNAIEAGWNGVRSNLGFFAGAFLFWLVVVMIQAFAKGIATKVLVFIFLLGLSLGYLKVALDVADGKKPEFKELFSCFALLHKYIAAAIVYILTVIAGLILLIVPGIIWMIDFGLHPFVIVSERLGPIAALRKSSSLTEGVILKLLVFLLALIGINFLGSIPAGLGLILTLPLSAIAAAHVYRQLEKASQ